MPYFKKTKKKKNDKKQFFFQKKNTIFFTSLITKQGSSFSTSMYKKSTHTDLGLRYDSAVCSNYKFNLISCLVYRAYRIFSSYLAFTDELEYLRQFFCKNQYPLKLIETKFCNTINKLRFDNTFVLTVHKKIIFVSLP